jgi:hypothetical protein
MENRGVDGGILSNNQIGIGTGKTGNGSLNISNARTTTLTLDSLNGLSRNFSIALWVNLSSGSDWQDVFSLGSSASGTFRMECSDGGKTLNLYGNGGYTDDGGAGWWTISNNTWYHFVYVIDDSNMYVYVNGVLQKSRTIYANDSLTGTISFGDSSISCKVNDFRIYNHCLTDVEIKNLSKALVLHYNFEELYKPVEYLQSSGTQYINSGVGYQNGASLSYELKVQFPNTTTSVGSGHHRATIANTNGLLKVGYAQTNFNAMEWNDAKVEWSSGNKDDTMNQYSYVNGELIAVNTTAPYDTNPYLLFACCSWTGGSNGVPPYSYDSVRIGGCKIYRNGTLLRDMIPVVRQTDGKPGFYDKVNGTFYVNAGTGEFYYGEGFLPVNHQNASINGNTITFSKSTDGWGDSGILAKQPVNKGFVSATVAQNNRYIMIGFAPVNNEYHYTQGYFIYPSNNAHYHIYELGVHIGDFGTYNANDVFKVIYDGSKISYYKNNSIVREIAVGGKMYMNITNYNAASATIKDVSFGPFEFVKDCSGNGHFARLQTTTAFSISSDTKSGEYSLRNISGDSNARINTTLNPRFITNGTIAFWYKKDSSAFSYNSGHFLVATQASSGNYFGATQNSTPFCSGDCSYQTFYLDGVANANSNVQDTNWHFYVFTGVNLSAWTSFSMQAHGDASWLYRGNIADFKIYNTSLSASDIRTLYEARLILDPYGNIYCEKFITNEPSCEFPSKKGIIKAHGFIKSQNKTQLNVEYEVLKFIEFTGSQYIPNLTLSRIYTIEADVAPSNTGAYHNIYDGENSTYQMLWVKSGPALEWNASSTVSFTNNTRIKVKTVADGSNVYGYLNGAQVWSGSETSFGNTWNCTLFNRGEAKGFVGKVYSMKIYNNGVLVRDFIPVRRKSDKASGLLDKENGVFYTSSGSGQFYTYTELDYIQTYDSQYINTGLKATDNITRIEGHFYKTSSAGTRGILFGLYGGGNDLMYFDYSESGITYHQTAFGYGSYPILYLNSGASNSDGDKMIVYTHNGNSFTYSVNGYSASGSSSAVFSTSYNHYLFAYNEQGSANYFYSCRMYSFKIWVDNLLVRDFTPAKRSDGVVGMYDKVYNKFYTNAGSGTFGFGDDLGTHLAPTNGTCYLVGAKNIYEDMGVSVNPNTTKK